MQIIIPTHGRADTQTTLSQLPLELREHTTLVCPENEALYLSRRCPEVTVVPQPDPTWGISPKRAWIAQHWHQQGYDKIVMLDDDLTFYSRTEPNSKKLYPILGEDLIEEFAKLEEKLGPEYPHVGFGTRFLNNASPGGWKSPGRMTAVTAYYLPIAAVEAEWGRVRCHEDQDVTLQLLRKGYPNAVYESTVQDTRMFTPGGCSFWRTIEIQNEEAYALHRLHPLYVTIIPRGEGKLHQVRCARGRALQDGIADRNKQC